MNLRQKKSIFVILAVVVVFILGVTGYIVFRGEPGTEKTPPAKELTGDVLQSGVYTNHTFDFEFNVPDTWQLAKDAQYIIRSPDYKEVFPPPTADGSGRVEVTQGAELYIAPQVSTVMKNIGDVQKFNALGSDGPVLSNERTIKVGGADALVYDFTDVNDAKGHHMDVVRNGVWIHVGIRYKGVDGKAAFDEVIKTFNFTK